MQPGQFRHKTEINIKAAAQQGDYGEIVESSSTPFVRFASVKWLTGKDEINDEVSNLIKNVEFTYRYESFISQLAKNNTITYNNETYYISSINMLGQGNQQTILIKAHTALN